LDAHLDRIFFGAAAIGIDIGKSKEELASIIRDTLLANAMETGVHLRLIISRGLKKTPYQHPNANIGGPTIVVIPEYKKADPIVNTNGIRIGTVSIERATAKTQDPKLNTLSKLNCILACIEADKLGFDEGLMLDINGFVSTCNSTNFFIVCAGEVWTSKGEYCLNGVTRGNIISLCEENKIPIFEKDFPVEDVRSADECFVTGTFAGVIPVVEVDGLKISNGKRGSMTERLQSLYAERIERLFPKS
jgi:branched-chain amino acid aminotransferase